MHEVLVNRLGGLSLPRKSVVRLTDRPDMTLDVYRGRKTPIHHSIEVKVHVCFCMYMCVLPLSFKRGSPKICSFIMKQLAVDETKLC